MKSLLQQLFNRSRSPEVPTSEGRGEAPDAVHSVEEVFTGIYTTNRWGGEAGEFCSGRGSSQASIVEPYVATISDLADRLGFRGTAFVDLGCGDFQVGRRLLPLCSSYVGVDVVPALVARNQRDFGDERTRFEHLDIISQPLPEGDVCFVRQVFQHLSNVQIASVLEKLEAFRWVFVTEHYPHLNASIVPNLDQKAGDGTRIRRNSGVYLSQPPFSLPEDSLSPVLEVAGGGRWRRRRAGVIRTVLYEPEAGHSEG
ncbi:MAG: methyltransferase [Acidobacteriota bacterium]